MFKKFFSLLLIVAIFSLNFDFHAIHEHNHDHEHSHGHIHSHEDKSNDLFECEDCEYINEVKSNFINTSNVFFKEDNINFITLSLNSFIIYTDLESQKQSRAPPSSPSILS